MLARRCSERSSGSPRRPLCSSQGRVDAVVNDNIAVLDYLASTGSKKIKIAGNAGSDVGKQALTFRKTDPSLQQRGRQGTRASCAPTAPCGRSREKYFKADVSVPQSGKVSVKGSDTERQPLAGASHDGVADAAWSPAGDDPADGDLSFVLGLAIAPCRRPGPPVALEVVSPAGTVLHLRDPRDATAGAALHRLLRTARGGDHGSTSYVAACLALSLNVGGYAAETIRASILSVPRGQFEAATTIGMDYGRRCGGSCCPRRLGSPFRRCPTSCSR